jgi:hypothetical protein
MFEHQNSGYYWHECDYCEDGTKYVPPPDYAQLERDSIVAWMRRTADQYADVGDLAGRRFLLIIADLIEKKEDKSGV